MLHMYNETSQPPEPYFGGAEFVGVEFVRGRVCQGPSLLGAEMSRNRLSELTIY